MRIKALALLLVLVVGFVLFRQANPPWTGDATAVGPAESPTTEPARFIPHEPADRPGSQGGSTQSNRRLGQLGSGPTTEFDPGPAESSFTRTIELDLHMEDWVMAQYNAAFDGVPEDYSRKRAAAEAGDADAALAVYMLIRRCLNSPFTEWQLEQSVQRLEERLVNLPEDAAGQADNILAQIDAVHNAYEFCSVLDGANVDLVAEALDWLNRAADLGHMGAQRIYHAHARYLIAGQDGSLAFQRPGLIEEFKARTDRYVRSLLEASHPHGLSLMSRMLTIGDVYERNYVMAYAYARATELVADGRLVEEARARMNWSGRYVSPTERMEAERIARDIVRDWRRADDR